MENPRMSEPQPHQYLAIRVLGALASGFRVIGDQLATADLNIHEGRLRSSGKPSEKIVIPDYPPMHDDTN